MTYRLSEAECRDVGLSARREWLLTNGMGGFAMGTASGLNTRRYHGLLVAATRPPAVRTVLLAAVDAFVRVRGQSYGVSCNQYPGAIYPEGHLYLRGFATDGEQAVWTYHAAEARLERRVRMAHGANAVFVRYENQADVAVELTLRPLVCHKFYHENFHERPGYPRSMSFPPDSTVVEHDGQALVLGHPGAARTPIHGWYYRFEHSRELDRGLEARDDLFCPCELRYSLAPGEGVALTASLGEPAGPGEGFPELAEGAGTIQSLRDGTRPFLVETAERASIMAGYPWFTDWGRDTMIALPGLCLCTGRVELARRILRDYGTQTFKGLIPNRFVDQGEQPDYNTVDATLWFANAAYKTLEAEWDKGFASEMLKCLEGVYRWHVEGTLYGIRVDPSDGLLTQGERGVQLTWMDAKVGDWVVTPRHGKPVEINGLWVNALRVLEWLASRLGREAAEYRLAAERAEECFERRFFHEGRGFYADTVDPLDVSLRPNQVIAMALPFGPARGDRARRALDIVTRELLTPRGLRTLGPKEMGYRGRYEGPLPELDAAYHQGTVWPWLLGPYASALVKVAGDCEGARAALVGAEEMLREYGLGGIAEVYDGDAPHRPNGCPFQAWSVAELLRAWTEDCGSS